MNEIEVGGVPVTPFKSMTEVLETLFDGGRIEPGFVVAVNAEKILAALNSPFVKQQLLNASMRYADGFGVVKTMRKKGVPNQKIPGCELWENIMQRAAELGHKVFLIGGSEPVNAQTAEKLQQQFNLKYLQRQNGYFDNEEDVINAVRTYQPDIVTVAMGSPKQELFISKLREVHPECFYMGVGGTYDVFVGVVSRAPEFFLKNNIEWLYRFIKQPSRFRRYLKLFKYFWLDLRGAL